MERNRAGWLEAVPMEKINWEMYMAAVKNSGGDALQYVPESLRVREMCMASLKGYGWGWDYIPESLRCGARNADEFLAMANVEAPAR